MRHGKRRTKFSRRKSFRVATLKCLATSVIRHEIIKTTRVKAKEAKRVIERLIEIAKTDSVTARRKAFSVLGDRTLVSKLFKEVAPLFGNRKGGYTRIIPFNFRKGDGADMVFLELTEKKPEEKPKHPKKTKAPEKAIKPKPQKPAQAKVAPEIKPEVKEEKAVEDVKKVKARDEIKKVEKQKGFLKKMGGFFRRKTNM
ncbi:MAG: 50S ribosomal protein L17 [Omnitrophica bacterium]|nr:50S ribosomal protein L17 [Candidatus Omnitrophota bacterium]